VYGTAKKANIVNCRINWTSSDILKALDKILRDHLDKPDYIPSIVNFSGSSLSSIIGKAFERLTQYGVVVVAAAGNSGEDVPRYPARNSWVVAVGAINQQETPAWFTNKRCDVYAPGQDVVTASVFSDTAVTTTSGTSFAAPYYAGLLACLIEGSDKFNSPATVSDFNYRMRNQMMEVGRIAGFPNGSMPVRTVTTNGLGGAYYTNPLKDVSDSDILAWLSANAGSPKSVADACKQYNLSLSRIANITGLTTEAINQYFIDAAVTPWWET
jgi:subtilisin family serine protease